MLSGVSSHAPLIYGLATSHCNISSTVAHALKASKISFFLALISSFCFGVALYLSSQIPNVALIMFCLTCAKRLTLTLSLSAIRYVTVPSVSFTGYTTLTALLDNPFSSHFGGVTSRPLCLGGIYSSPSFMTQNG